jgi:predicted DNA binding CopG/RHH family protein
MRKEYDFDKLKGRRNPYSKKLKKQITIRVGVDVLEYFKQLSDETGIPYQNLINMYLRDCVVSGKRPSFKWALPRVS